MKLTRELESVGIRLNKSKPRITIKKQKTGGIMMNSMVPLTKIDAKMVKNIMFEYKIHNAHVNMAGDYDVDDLIDAIEGNVQYIKCLYVYNKIDICSVEDIDLLSRSPNSCVVSMKQLLGIDSFLAKMWDMLDIVRVYTKKRGAAPDLEDPLILTNGRNGKSVKGALLQIHKSMLDGFGGALVWGKSVKHNP